MRYLMAIVLLAAWPGQGAEIRASGAGIHEFMKSADIDATLARIQDPLDVIMKPNVALIFRVSAGKASGWKTHEDADEVWVVRHGTARVSLGESAASARQYDVGAGDLVVTPRNKGYQIDPGAGRFEYVVIRTFPTEVHQRGAQPGRGGRGGRGAPRPVPDVVKNADIEHTIATSNANQPMLPAMGAFSMNMPIYSGAPGPYEAHAGYEQIYFVRFGSARAKLDGNIVNQREAQPGEVRGTGVIGARDYTMGVGDILFVARNTAHFMDPGPNKYAYLLAHIRD